MKKSLTFYYYLAQLREKKIKWSDFFSWIIVAVVVLAGAWGFVVIGSPFAQREKRVDEKRVGDLQMIQNQIIYYWQRKEKLPQNLSELNDSISGFFVPTDPQSRAEYEY